MNGRSVYHPHPMRKAGPILILLIGVLASEAGALIWSLDQDFQRLERLTLVNLYG